MRGTLKICCSYEFSPPIPLPFILAIPNAELVDTENLNALYFGKKKARISQIIQQSSNFVTFNRSTSWKPQLRNMGMAQPNWCSTVGVIESETHQRLIDLLNNHFQKYHLSLHPCWSFLDHVANWAWLVWARFLSQHIWPEITVPGIKNKIYRL